MIDDRIYPWDVRFDPAIHNNYLICSECKMEANYSCFIDFDNKNKFSKKCSFCRIINKKCLFCNKEIIERVGISIQKKEQFNIGKNQMDRPGLIHQKCGLKYLKQSKGLKRILGLDDNGNVVLNDNYE